MFECNPNHADGRVRERRIEGGIKGLDCAIIILHGSLDDYASKARAVKKGKRGLRKKQQHEMRIKT